MNMGVDLKDYMKETASWVSTHMIHFIPKDIPETLLKSMEYSLNAGGKRIRPILLIATLEAFGCKRELGLEVAAAIEMIHTYSLIHDDLPAMDNDDFRRGKPTNHKVFGEGIAILAGDALLTHAFQLVASISSTKNIPSQVALDLVSKLATAAGPKGMVGGQILDLEAENKSLTLLELEQIHRHKTGDLISFSVYAGAVLANASDLHLAALLKFANKIGLAFQIQDDILDITGVEVDLGKPIGSDQRHGKSTYPGIIGIDAAKAWLNELISEAKAAINLPGLEHRRLAELADFFVTRQF